MILTLLKRDPAWEIGLGFASLTIGQSAVAVGGSG